LGPQVDTISELAGAGQKDPQDWKVKLSLTNNCTAPTGGADAVKKIGTNEEMSTEISNMAALGRSILI
jgi:hypothetical protein